MANKDGFAHFDFDKPRAFEAFKTWTRFDGVNVTAEAFIKTNLFQIAAWTAEMMGEVVQARVGQRMV